MLWISFLNFFYGRTLFVVPSLWIPNEVGDILKTKFQLVLLLRFNKTYLRQYIWGALILSILLLQMLRKWTIILWSVHNMYSNWMLCLRMSLLWSTGQGSWRQSSETVSYLIIKNYLLRMLVNMLNSSYNFLLLKKLKNCSITNRLNMTV